MTTNTRSSLGLPNIVWEVVESVVIVKFSSVVLQFLWKSPGDRLEGRSAGHHRRSTYDKVHLSDVKDPVLCLRVAL